MKEPKQDHYMEHDRASLTAHAILASFHFWHRPEPFCFNFIDYLTIALGGTVDIAIFQETDGRCLSTVPAFHLKTAPSWQTAVPFFGARGIKLLISPVTPGDAAAVGKAVRLLVQVKAVLEQNAMRFRSVGIESTGLREALASGMQAILADRKSGDGGSLLTGTCPGGSLEAVFGGSLARLADFLAESLPAGAEFGIVLPYFYQSKWQLTGIRADVSEGYPTRNFFPVNSAWLPVVSRSFMTGFTSWCAAGEKRRLLCIPCHFGGVPWLCLCQEFAGEEDPNRWWHAHVSYRDIAARYTDSIRQGAPRRFTDEMLRIFRDVRADSRDHTETRTILEKAWGDLKNLYPIRTLRFEKCAESEKNRTHVFRFADGDYVLAFSESDSSPFLNPYPVLQQKGEAWSLFDEKFREHFMGPALADLEKEKVARERDVARAAYSVGHPLGKRFEAVLTGTTQLRNEIGEKLPNASWLAHSTKRIARQVETCKRTAEIMDLMGGVLGSELIERLAETKKTCFGDADYPIKSHLEQASAACKETRPGISVIFVGEEEIFSAKVQPFLNVFGPNRRPFDALYDELLYEIILNAVTDTGDAGLPTAKIQLAFESAQDTSRFTPAIVFTNECQNQHKIDALNLEPGQWHEWPRDRMGGLRFLTEALRIFAAGTLHVCISRNNLVLKFNMRLGLRGLTQA